MSTSAPSSNRTGLIAHNVAHPAGEIVPEVQIGTTAPTAVPVLVEAGEERGMRAPLAMAIAADANVENVDLLSNRAR